MPSNAVMMETHTLYRQNRMAVFVSVDGSRDIAPETYRAKIVHELEGAGITVIPSNDKLTFPMLCLDVQVISSGFRNDGPLLICYTMSLSYHRLFPNPIAGSSVPYFDGSLWERTSFGYMPAIQALSLGGEAGDLADAFVESYRKANPVK